MARKAKPVRSLPVLVEEPSPISASSVLREGSPFGDSSIYLEQTKTQKRLEIASLVLAGVALVITLVAIALELIALS